MKTRICLVCNSDMDYLGERDKKHWFECPNCSSRECYTDPNISHEIEVARLDPRFKLGSKMGY